MDACLQVIDLLRAMAQSGCTVACTIHQPSSKIISQFDDVLVISQGKCYYCGPQDEIFNSFSEAGFTCPKYYNISEYGSLKYIIFKFKKNTVFCLLKCLVFWVLNLILICLL